MITVHRGNFFLITCEHGGNRIPAPYRHLFRGCEALLATHRGWDPGALLMARDLARALDAPLVASTTSRLLIDLNRSIGNPRLYSEATRSAPASVRRAIVEQHYRPYRTEAEQHVTDKDAAGRPVIHISSHSFTPELDGEVRNADVGLLYNPARPGEAALSRRWQQQLEARLPHVIVRRNYPYQGKADGLASHLRRRFPADAYIGIELEINQKHVFKGGRQWRELRRGIVEALVAAIAVEKVER